MFVPEIYRPACPSWAAELMRDHPLAILVTSGDGGPLATHVPMLTGDHADGDRAWPDAVLFGHMNRLNPHWDHLSDGASATLIFSGPHGYVSPALYQVSPAAPTWNFTAVHVFGTLRRVEDRHQTRRIVRETASTFERRFGAGWDPAGSFGYFEQLLPGVGAFEFTVLGLDSMFKLSQEQPAAVRERVVADFSGRDSTAYRQLAALMARVGAEEFDDA